MPLLEYKAKLVSEGKFFLCCRNSEVVVRASGTSPVVWASKCGDDGLLPPILTTAKASPKAS
jgi:hypothetical protein